MKHAILSILFAFLSTTAVAQDKFVISTGTDIAQQITTYKTRIKTLDKYSQSTILEVSKEDLSELSRLAHQTRRCGGFFFHDSVREARQTVNKVSHRIAAQNYVVQNLPLVKGLIKNVREPNIQKNIRELSAFHNRYYQSETGVQAAAHIKDNWSKYAKTQFYNHKKWKQPSVIATIPGSTTPDEIIIIGGHLDSISGWFGGSSKRAPGADDNASGISTVGEILRVLTEAKYKPQRTLQFMGYAAEEVGLRGSSEIAREYKKRGAKVVGVMQLDMTNFKGSDKTIYLTTDYTDASQTEFLTRLIDTYLKVPYAQTRCGYACSDHASWTKNSFRAVFPFEAAKGGMNNKIHTAHDTIDVSGGHALHAVNFAKLGLAYLVELDLQGVNVTSKQ